MTHDCETCPVLADARAELRELRRRIRLARKLLLAAGGYMVTGTTAWLVLDLRKPLKARGRK